MLAFETEIICCLIRMKKEYKDDEKHLWPDRQQSSILKEISYSIFLFNFLNYCWLLYTS